VGEKVAEGRMRGTRPANTSRCYHFFKAFPFVNRRVFILGLVLMAGCARFQPRPISPADSAAKLESRSLTNAALKVFLENNLHREITNWPHPLWDFDMLTLAAFYYHPSLEVARAQWHVAQAGEASAGGRPNPTLTVTPGYNSTFVSGVSPWFPAVNLDLPIETAGKRAKRLSQAEHLSEAARLNISSAAWQVRSNLRSSLLASAAAHERLLLLSGQVSIQEQIVKTLEQEAQAGALASSELGVPRIALQKTRLDLADAQSQLADASSRLSQALGVQASAMDEAELAFDPLKDFQSPTNLTSAEVRHAALLSRPDILSSLAEYAAAESALQLEIAKQYPDVHLNPGYQFDQGADKWSLGIGVDLPVFNHNEGPIAEAKAGREEAAAKFNELQANVLAEIERAERVFQASEQTVGTFAALAAEQKKQNASIEAQVNAGAAERLDLLNAKLEQTASALVQLDGRFKLQQAVGALEDAVQRPLTGDIFSAEKSPHEPEDKK
jgi:outer membrane protein TolC